MDDATFARAIAAYKGRLRQKLEQIIEADFRQQEKRWLKFKRSVKCLTAEMLADARLAADTGQTSGNMDTVAEQELATSDWQYASLLKPHLGL